MSKKILVVEDDKFLLKAILKKLSCEKCEVISARTGDEALDKLGEKPDVIWLDLLLPKMEGLEFLQNLRKNDKYKKYKNTPVIVVSNSGGSDKIKKAFELNVVDYLVKAEHSLEEIISRIKQLI